MNAQKIRRLYPSIHEATERSINCISNSRPGDLFNLSRSCPGLVTFDWRNYLECSVFRLEKVLRFLDSHVDPARGPVFDCGAWLGNFSLALKFDGYEVIASEMWARYTPALDRQKQMLADCEIDTEDLLLLRNGWHKKPRHKVALLMSVIEHIPDSPRSLLRMLYDSLMPGGFLILDTPNLAYIANRRKLAAGASPYVPIMEQFYTESPFEGHVREYTAAELKWMLEVVGFRVIETSFFNYSMFGVKHPYLMNARSIWPMWMDETKRELIFMAAEKPL